MTQSGEIVYDSAGRLGPNVLHKADHAVNVSASITMHQALKAVQELAAELPADRLALSQAEELEQAAGLIRARLGRELKPEPNITGLGFKPSRVENYLPGVATFSGSDDGTTLILYPVGYHNAADFFKKRGKKR